MSRLTWLVVIVLALWLGALGGAWVGLRISTPASPPVRYVHGCTGLPERLGDARVLIRPTQTSVWLDGPEAVRLRWSTAVDRQERVEAGSEITPEMTELVLPAGCEDGVSVRLDTLDTP